MSTGAKMWGNRRREIRFNAAWGDLAQYNAEVARGLIHTQEWNAKMSEKQRQWDAINPHCTSKNCAHV